MPRGAPPPRLTVALVRGLRGLRGQVRVELLTDTPERRFAAGARLYPEGDAEALTVAESRPVADGPGWWLRFEEIPDRAVAEERLRGRYLEAEDARDTPGPDRWFWHQLLGLAVRSTGGEPLGTVTDVYRAGGAEVFVVRGPRGEFDVPGVRGIVTRLEPGGDGMEVDLDRLAPDARPVDDGEHPRPRDRRRGRPRAAGGAGSGAGTGASAAPEPPDPPESGA